jgi:hypothetical protein
LKHRTSTIHKKEAVGAASFVSKYLIRQCARDDSNVRPLVSETNALSN